jgi:hypothetical protein
MQTSCKLNYAQLRNQNHYRKKNKLFPRNDEKKKKKKHADPYAASFDF